MKISKKIILKKFFAIFLSAFSVFIFSCAGSGDSDVHSFTAMNTFMTVKSFGSGCKKANKAVQAEIERLEGILSTTLETSDVYRLNSAGLESEGEFSVQNEVIFLIQKSLDFYERTSGAFNPSLYPIIREWGFTTEKYKIPSDERIAELLKYTDFSLLNGATGAAGAKIRKPSGMQLDFGAVGKGYAGDSAISILKKYGIKSALLDFGGNIQALGSKPDGSAWTVGIKNPWYVADGSSQGQNAPVACGVKIKDKAVITSGGYERFFIGEDGKKYIHIFDGKTGRPVENDLESVTIISDEGLYGDALSTSLFVMGKERAIDFWKQSKDFDFILITKDKELIHSSSITDSLKIIYDFSKIISVDF